MHLCGVLDDGFYEAFFSPASGLSVRTQLFLLWIYSFLLIYRKSILLPKLVMAIIDVLYFKFGIGLMLFLKYILLIAKMSFTGT